MCTHEISNKVFRGINLSNYFQSTMGWKAG